MALQESAFAEEGCQAWRNELVETCHKQVAALNPELVSVKLRRQYVEKYKKRDAFWNANDILLFEKVRRELRGLICFLDENGGGKKWIVTKLTDPIIDSQEGEQLNIAYDFEDYRAKVNRYVNEHGNMLAIYKLTYNILLAAGDYQELERVLTCELGSKEDYKREFGDKPFGLLIRQIAKLDHEAAMQAFSSFINDQSLNQNQIRENAVQVAAS